MSRYKNNQPLRITTVYITSTQHTTTTVYINRRNATHQKGTKSKRDPGLGVRQLLPRKSPRKRPQEQVGEEEASEQAKEAGLHEPLLSVF